MKEERKKILVQRQGASIKRRMDEVENESDRRRARENERKQAVSTTDLGLLLGSIGDLVHDLLDLLLIQDGSTSTSARSKIKTRKVSESRAQGRNEGRRGGLTAIALCLALELGAQAVEVDRVGADARHGEHLVPHLVQPHVLGGGVL